MNKYELAQYLVNLNTLLQAQTANINIASQTLATEYEACWKQLKEAINNETRQSADKHNDRNQSGTDQQGDLARRG